MDTDRPFQLFDEFEPHSLPRAVKATRWLTVSSGASDWHLPFFLASGIAAGPTLVVLAGIHGDEYEGMEAIPEVFRAIDPAQLRGTVLMLSACNMPAYLRITRASPIDGLNLARVFPGNQTGSITERIAFWITEKLIRHADFLIDLHSAGQTYNLPTLIGHYYSPAAHHQRALSGARAFGAPVIWSHPPDDAPGRTLSAANSLGIPAIYTEAPGGGWVQPDDVACFVEGVLNVMKHLGMCHGAIRARPLKLHLIGSGNLDRVIEAPVEGYFRPSVELLDRVRAGQYIGRVQDLFGEGLADLHADRDGIVIMLRRPRRVQRGDGLALVTGMFD